MPTHLGFRWEAGASSPAEGEGGGEGVELVEDREVMEAKMSHSTQMTMRQQCFPIPREDKSHLECVKIVKSLGLQFIPT